MSDVHQFLNSYQEALDHEIHTAGWPEEILATYSFESCLKHDGGKEVYLVRDRRTGAKVILRVTSHDSGDRADAEWAILSNLDHPGIPKTFGRLVSKEKSYVAREFIPGQPLDTVVAQGALSPQEVFAYAKKLCDILDYQHRQTPPVIHRDIKPQNVILRPDGTIALTDFGIARTFKPGADSDTQYVGTLPYAPPEQYGYAQSSPQTDIYAFGIVLVYLSTGSPNRQNLSEKIKDKRLLALIRRCIAFDPADRFSSVEEVRDFISGKRSFRSKLIIGFSAALLCVLVAVSLFVLFNRPVETTPPWSAGDPLFDSTKTGNLPGNLSNDGYIVEGDHETYISIYNGIYILDPDGTIGRCVIDDQFAKYMNFYQGKLYFSGGVLGLYCADPSTGEVSRFFASRVDMVFIDDGILYFEYVEDDSNLYTIGFDGQNLRKVSDFGKVYNRNVVGGYQYYTKPSEGRALFRANLATGEEELLYSSRSDFVSVYGTSIYFVDASLSRTLMRMDLDGGNAEKLIIGSYSALNATPYGIFLSNSRNQLVLVSLDGESLTQLETSGSFIVGVTRDWVMYDREIQGDEYDFYYWLIRPDGSKAHPLTFYEQT